MPREFLNTSSLKEAVSLIEEKVPLGISTEKCPLTSSLKRIVSEDIIAPEDMPPFSKSTVDGYAVKAADTFGASESTPIYLNLIGEVEIGKGGFKDTIKGNGVNNSNETSMSKINTKGNGNLRGFSGETKLLDYSAIYIPTGGMLPEGADAVVMIEYTQSFEKNMIEVTKAVSPGENIIYLGEDVKMGDILFLKGHSLRPQDIGIMAGLGLILVHVFSKPKVAIISTGSEICPISEKPQAGKIRDINAYTLSALVEEFGGEPVNMGIYPDDPEKIKDIVKKAVNETDCILISGGSSVGIRDFTYQTISDLGPPGVFIHGLSIRPGKPAIIGQSGTVPIIGLPGHPASAIIVAMAIVRPIIYRLAGLSMPILERKITEYSRKVLAKLTRNISSPPGKEDFIRIVLSFKNKEGGDLLATPILGKSGLISTFINAHGLLRIPSDSEGFQEGEIVEIILLPL